MRLELSMKSSEFARIMTTGLAITFASLSVLPLAANAQTPGIQPAVMSTGNVANGVRVSMPSGQMILDRNAPITSSQPSKLELVEPHQADAPKSRPISSNMLQQKLPAAAIPTNKTDYSTASPYQLREVNSKSALRVTPVSTAKNVELSPTEEEIKQNAPKVSRIPLPRTQTNDLMGAQQPLRDEAMQFTDDKSVGSQSKKTPSPLELPSLEKMPSLDLTTLPTLDSQQSVSFPTLLPRSSAAELNQSKAAPTTVLTKESSSPTVALPDLNNSSLSLPTLVQLPTLESSPVPSISNSQPVRTPSMDVGTNVQMQSPTTPVAQRSMPKALALQGSPLSGNERLRMQTPRIQVALNGPKELSVGAPQPYQVTVRNDDRIGLGGLILRLDIPPGVDAQAQKATHGKGEVERAADGTTMLTWSFENLEAGTEAVLPLQVIAQSPRNFAVAMEWTLLPLAGTAGIDVLTPQLELALEGPQEVNFSEPNVFRLHIRNRGNAEANDVSVKLAAQHFGSSSTEIGAIGAGQQQTVDVELVFNEPGNIIIAAEATAAGNVAAASQVGVQVRQSVLEAALEAPERAYHSAEVPYILTLKNVGDAVARNAKAVISLPVDCVASSLPPQATQQGGNIVIDLQQLRPNQIAEMPFALTFAREGDNQVSVQCSASSGLPVQCASITNIKAVTDLKLLVTDPVAPAPVNGEVEYELKVVNRGSKAAEQVSVVALFSKDIEPTRAEGQRSQIVTGQVRFQPITRIEPGQTVALKVFAQASAAGTHRFRAEVRTNEADVKLVQEQSTEYMETIRRTASSPSTLMR